jgi:hypothetical protein
LPLPRLPQAGLALTAGVLVTLPFVLPEIKLLLKL